MEVSRIVHSKVRTFNQILSAQNGRGRWFLPPDFVVPRIAATFCVENDEMGLRRYFCCLEFFSSVVHS